MNRLPGASRRPLLAVVAALLVALLVAGCPLPHIVSLATLRAEDLPSDPAVLAAKAEAMLQEKDASGPAVIENVLVVLDKQRALPSVKGKPEEYEVLWRLARATFWLCDEAEKDSNRRKYFALKGVDYADAAIVANPKRAEGHYYRALNIGYLAKVSPLSALDLLVDIEREGKTAADLDESFDHAGPLRLLCSLYRLAPAWPQSVGDPAEALDRCKRAVEVDGDFPFNRLANAETLLGDGNKPGAETEARLVCTGTTTDPLWKSQLPLWRKEAEELLIKKLGKPGCK